MAKRAALPLGPGGPPDQSAVRERLTWRYAHGPRCFRQNGTATGGVANSTGANSSAGPSGGSPVLATWDDVSSDADPQVAATADPEL